MSQTQTHIVYQNRIEHDFYESGMMIPLIGALVTGAIVFVAIIEIAKKVTRSWNVPSAAIGGGAVVAFFSGVLVFKWLML